MISTHSVSADIGSIAIENHGIRMFFENGIGDGLFNCIVSTERDDVPIAPPSSRFIGCFEVGTGSDAWLLDYDCGGGRIHKFKEGRWFVYNKKGEVYVQYIDVHTNLIKGEEERVSND